MKMYHTRQRRQNNHVSYDGHHQSRWIFQTLLQIQKRDDSKTENDDENSDNDDDENRSEKQQQQSSSSSSSSSGMADAFRQLDLLQSLEEKEQDISSWSTTEGRKADTAPDKKIMVDKEVLLTAITSVVNANDNNNVNGISPEQDFIHIRTRYSFCCCCGWYTFYWW